MQRKTLFFNPPNFFAKKLSKNDIFFSINDYFLFFFDTIETSTSPVLQQVDATIIIQKKFARNMKIGIFFTLTILLLMFSAINYQEINRYQ